MTGDSYRLVIIEDRPVLVLGLRSLLRETSDLKVVGTAGDTHTGYQMVLREEPDLVLINMVISGRGAFVLADELSSRLPDTRVVFLSHFFSAALLDLALRLNVRGLLLTDEPENQLVDGLRRAARGETVYSTKLADHLETDEETGRIRAKHHSVLSELTTRQLTLLQLVACGMPPAEIARALSISRSAVDNQKYAIMKKFDIHDRVELMVFAYGEGLGFSRPRTVDEDK